MDISIERLKEIFSYNPDTGEIVWKRRRGLTAKIAGAAHKSNKTSNITYSKIYLGGKKIYAHRLAYALYYGEWPDKVDHVDGNGLNNRISNLRNVNHAQNMRNARRYCTNKSGATGVHFYKSRNLYAAKIHYQNTAIHLGYFEDIEDAIKARKDAEKKYGYHENHGRDDAIDRMQAREVA